MRKALIWEPWAGSQTLPRSGSAGQSPASPSRLACCCSLLVLAACGSHKKGLMASPDDANATALVVDPGPPEAEYAYLNGPFASVTLCAPGTADCQTIDHLLVDTGSVGVRVLGSVLTLPLPIATTDSGLLLAECLPFVDGDAWGLVRSADVQIGGEFASNIAIQVIGDTAVSDNIPIPANCNDHIITELNGDQGLGAYGILGVGLQPVDCGSRCPATSSYSIYYACSASCRPISIPVAQQVPNPVAAFPVDNNGVVLQLPDVPETGAPSVSGVMVFGIGTQANNGLGSAQILTSDSWGTLSTAFPPGGEEYMAILDSGSNGLFFLDEGTSGLRACPARASGFYCPPKPTDLTAAILGIAGEVAAVKFSVASAIDLVESSGVNCAFSNIAGSFPGFPDPNLPAFDWGLPFYYGRSIYHAIDGADTPGGPGPYFAF
jgi:hypothetical protein